MPNLRAGRYTSITSARATTVLFLFSHELFQSAPYSRDANLLLPRNSANNRSGVYQIGVLCSFTLFGITCTQAYLYYSRYPNDHAWLKYFGRLHLCGNICELGHAACVGGSLYEYTISSYGQDLNPFLTPIPQSLGGAVLLSGIIGPAVQSFFSFRISVLAPNARPISVVIWLLALVQLGMTATLFGLGLHMRSLESFAVQWHGMLDTAWVVSVGNDIIITVTLATVLYQAKNRIAEGSLALVDQLIKWTVETGLLTRSFLWNHTASLLFSYEEQLYVLLILGLLTSLTSSSRLACDVCYWCST
ncbi:hypothetical protein MIND_00638900 [Mycena indigotica]|uniref:DUF6534 domain-containing protein n=1 Tax=Mycena indigotica TaxID=2126181 RepID=A0A8H6W9F4_9AGAR|nr:uncharacterized protein MIND_00638900 [Mycena indigotica]KAF7304074.1 hypothetical protein MIND_00638900 [Mycena indigotica]